MPAVRRNARARANVQATASGESGPFSPRRFDYATWSNLSDKLVRARHECSKRGLVGVYHLNYKTTMARIRSHDEAEAEAQVNAARIESQTAEAAAASAELLTTANSEVARLQAEVDRLTQVNETLSVEVAANAQVVASTIAEVQQLRSDLATLQRDNAVLVAQVDAAAQVAPTTPPAATNAKIAQLQAENSRLQTTDSSLRAELSDVQEQLENLQEQFRDRPFGEEEASQEAAPAPAPLISADELAELRAKVDLYDRKVRRQKRRIDELLEQNEDTTRRMAIALASAQDRDRLEGENTALRAEVAAFDEERARLEEHVERAVQEAERLAEKVDEWEQWYDATRGREEQDSETRREQQAQSEQVYEDYHHGDESRHQYRGEEDQEDRDRPRQSSASQPQYGVHYNDPAGLPYDEADRDEQPYQHAPMLIEVEQYEQQHEEDRDRPHRYRHQYLVEDAQPQYGVHYNDGAGLPYDDEDLDEQLYQHTPRQDEPEQYEPQQEEDYIPFDEEYDDEDIDAP